MKTKITQEIEVQPFTTPNFVLTVAAPGSRTSGFVETPKLPLADVDVSTLSALCDKFRHDVFEKAGKDDPRLT